MCPTATLPPPEHPCQNARMKKPKKSNAKTASPSAAEIIDRALERDWKRALSALESARSGEAEQWDAKWEAVDAILAHDPPLYLAAGLKTERAFRERYLPGVAQSTMRDNALVGAPSISWASIRPCCPRSARRWRG